MTSRLREWMEALGDIFWIRPALLVLGGVLLALAGLLLCFVVVVLGAYVRLTASGLGCPDWPGCYGHLTPTGAEQNVASSNVDFLYFSFASLTTTGFGDLTDVNHLGRSLAVTEVLVGQIYLVTVVALIVSTMARPPRPDE